jgi:hypothetical protein
MTSKEKVKLLTQLCDDCFDTLRNGAQRAMSAKMVIDQDDPERWTTDGDVFCGKCEPLIRSLMEFDA